MDRFDLRDEPLTNAEREALQQQRNDETTTEDLRANSSWALVFVCSLATTVCGFEMMLTNGNLAYMVGSLALTPDQSTWIVALFFAAQLVGVCLSSLCWRALSIRNYLLLAMLFFTLFELVAANATTATVFALSRFGEGLVNGGITATTLILIMRKISPERRLLTYFLFGTPPILTVPFAFILGGDFINNGNWRDIYMFAAMLGCFLLLAFNFFATEQKTKLFLFLRVDLISIVLLLFCSFSTCIFLLRGTTENWFESNLIQLIFAVSVTSWTLFICRQNALGNPFLKFSLCKDIHIASILAINFLFGCIMVYSFELTGFLVLSQDYNSVQIGLLLLFASATIPFFTAFQSKLEHRLVLAAGMLCFWLSGLMNANLTRVEDISNLWTSQIIRAVAQTLILWPLWGLTISEIKRQDYENAAKLYGFSRVLGVTTGLALLGFLQTWRNNFHSTHVTETLNDVVVKTDLQRFQSYFLTHGMALPQAKHQAMSLLMKEIRIESAVLSYGDIFWMTGTAVLLGFIPLLFIRGKNGSRSIFELFIRRSSKDRNHPGISETV